MVPSETKWPTTNQVVTLNQWFPFSDTHLCQTKQWQEAKPKLISIGEYWGVNFSWNKCKRHVPEHLREHAQRQRNETRRATLCQGQILEVISNPIQHLNPTEAAIFFPATPKNQGGGV